MSLFEPPKRGGPDSAGKVKRTLPQAKPASGQHGVPTRRWDAGGAAGMAEGALPPASTEARVASELIAR